MRIIHRCNRILRLQRREQDQQLIGKNHLLRYNAAPIGTHHDAGIIGISQCLADNIIDASDECVFS